MDGELVSTQVVGHYNEVPHAYIDVYFCKQMSISPLTQCIIEGHEEIDTTKIVPEKVLNFFWLLLVLLNDRLSLAGTR